MKIVMYADSTGCTGCKHYLTMYLMTPIAVYGQR